MYIHTHTHTHTLSSSIFITHPLTTHSPFPSSSHTHTHLHICTFTNRHTHTHTHTHRGTRGRAEACCPMGDCEDGFEFVCAFSHVYTAITSAMLCTPFCHHSRLCYLSYIMQDISCTFDVSAKTTLCPYFNISM